MTAFSSKILVADDDKHIQEVLQDTLKEITPHILTAGTAAETWRSVVEQRPDLVLLDIKFPDSHDLGLLKRIKEEIPGTEVIVLSGLRNVPQIVDSIKLGAHDFVTKPFVREELQKRVLNALEIQKLRKSQEYLLRELEGHNGLDVLVGESSALRRVRESLRKMADGNGCVLIQGESGTGKELAARALHYLSRRRSNPFVVVNSSAIPEALTESLLFGHRRGAFTGATESAKGFFESAEDGTLFLDEIGDMPLSQQNSLLRVLEYRRFKPVGEINERECRARFVLATNQNLRERINERLFREDLYYRIHVASVVMPPLRERREDIPGIVDYFCRRHCADMGRPRIHPDPAVLATFQQYHWPGNVRELKNVLETVVMLADTRQDAITIKDLPPHLVMSQKSESVPREMTALERHEKQAIASTLVTCGGNFTKAANILGLHRNTLRNKIRYYGIAAKTE